MAASLLLFTILVLIYIVIADIITILFRLTGLTEETARFQVLSLLTNTGYTTRASEALMSSRKRQRLARATMLFGYIFTISIVSAMVNFFTTIGKSELHTLIYVVPVIIVIMLIFGRLRKSPAFKSRFDAKIETIGNKIMFGSDVNPIVVMENYGDTVLANVCLNHVPEILNDVKLSEASLMSEHNVMVVLIKNRSGDAKQATADSVLKKNNIGTVLGKLKDIKSVFQNTDKPQQA